MDAGLMDGGLMDGGVIGRQANQPGVEIALLGYLRPPA
jgi:hypothetical protein